MSLKYGFKSPAFENHKNPTLINAFNLMAPNFPKLPIRNPLSEIALSTTSSIRSFRLLGYNIVLYLGLRSMLIPIGPSVLFRNPT